MDPEGDSAEFLLIKQLLGQVECAHCGAAYHPDDARLVEGREGLWILVVRCRECLVRGIVLVTVGDIDEEDDDLEEDPEVMAQIERLEEEEAENLSPLTADDVLDWHTYLRSFEGDLRDLLEE